MAVEWHDGHANSIAKRIREQRYSIQRSYGGCIMSMADAQEGMLDDLTLSFYERFELEPNVDHVKFLERAGYQGDTT